MTRKTGWIRPGRSFPPGATVQATGTNFCVFSRNCDSVELLLFDRVDAEPTDVIELDPTLHRTFYYWHIFLEGVGHGQLYGWRVKGPFIPEEGLFFRGDKLLLDPYTKSVAVPSTYRPEYAIEDGDNAATMMKSVVVDLSRYDWDNDHAPHMRPGKTLIYEMHVAGFTKHPSSAVAAQHRGTYSGLIEKIPYLKELGVTTVELMPVQQFDPFAAPQGRTNFWGYSPVAFFAPHAGYATGAAFNDADAGEAFNPSGPDDPTAVVDEFRDMVKALHAAGIRIILDVVYNHTAEGDEDGPTLSFRGLENRAYYIPHPEGRGRYANYSGCGNTVNGNQSIVRRLILDSLRYWVSEMHIDAFRFDLASVLARDEWGAPLKSPPILWEIESDPVLAGTPIIAEAWDAAGLYQVGSFIGHRWAEWNGRFRDDVRRFIRGDGQTVWPLMHRITGSPDLYLDAERDIGRTINFLTAHDGFTLMDLVSYARKHNEANGEENRDGSDENFSSGWGAEGETDDVQIKELRLQQIRNMLLILLLSQGTPMILMGDEMGRSQKGNNNAYCQDNALGWLNWEDLQRNGSIASFLKKVLSLRRLHPAWEQDSSWILPVEHPRIRWSGVRLHEPDVSDHSHTLAFTLEGPGPRMHVMLNAYHERLSFALPEAEMRWHLLINTAAKEPFAEGELSPVSGRSYYVDAHASVLLIDGVSQYPFTI